MVLSRRPDDEVLAAVPRQMFLGSFAKGYSITTDTGMRLNLGKSAETIILMILT